ncbi:MAG: glycosyltransferase family 2 protein [Proteobacteria bacterium]|jgi:GT2 family glycosyltransferase|nr:glycosyltransferase family 2 protein [Pseudomonadota bacterium]
MGSFLHVLFPTFDRPERARELVRQLAAQTYRDFDVVCIDHGTVPVEFQGAERERLTVVRAGAELWWAGAMNAGLEEILPRAGSGDAVVTINDDVRVGPEYLAALAGAAAEHPRALVGSVCIDDLTRTVRYAELRLRWLRAEFASSYRDRTPDALPAGAVLDCDVLSGRGTLIPVRALRDVGLFDERRLPHYSADYELSWRARRAGYRLVCAADARVGTGWGRRGNVRSGLAGYVLDRRLPGNLLTTYAFARSCFDRPYALWYTALTGARLVAGYTFERRGPR